MKKYTISSLVFIAVVTFFVYIEQNSISTFDIFGINISLPNALWTALFLILFFIFSLMFMVFLNLKNTFFQKNIKKDIQTLIANIQNKILYKDETKAVKILTTINTFVTENIKGLEIIPKKTENFEFLEDIEKLKKGEIINISKYKLNENNPWFILNIKNRLKKEPNYAKEALKKFKNEEIKKMAFYEFAKFATVNEILRYDYPVTLDIIIAHPESEGLQRLLEKAALSPREEIEAARKIYGTKTPDEELETVKPLKWAYAYLALKYEHLELAKEIIEENSLKFFEYFLKLRLNGIKADIDEYIYSEI